jgi:hypothetical protein
MITNLTVAPSRRQGRLRGMTCRRYLFERMAVAGQIAGQHPTAAVQVQRLRLDEQLADRTSSSLGA